MDGPPPLPSCLEKGLAVPARQDQPGGRRSVLPTLDVNTTVLTSTVLLNPPAPQVLTNDTLRAPAHRVLSPAKQPRISAPYHFSPARQVGQSNASLLQVVVPTLLS